MKHPKTRKTCFPVITFSTGIKDICLEKFHSENFCDEENLEFSNSSSISKSNLTVKTFHLKVVEVVSRRKILKNCLMSVTGNSVQMKLNKRMSL